MRMLIQGHTDKVVMEKMGFGARRFRRHLRSAMDKLGARSRFQAGYLVAEAGWIADDSAADSGQSGE